MRQKERRDDSSRHLSYFVFQKKYYYYHYSRSRGGVPADDEIRIGYCCCLRHDITACVLIPTGRGSADTRDFSSRHNLFMHQRRKMRWLTMQLCTTGRGELFVSTCCREYANRPVKSLLSSSSRPKFSCIPFTRNE